MSALAQWKSTDDPRTPLEKAKRPELVRHARAHGLTDITEAMPAMLIRERLKARGLVDIKIAPRPLGMPPGTVGGAAAAQSSDEKVVEVDALADLERQFAQQSAPPPAPVIDDKAVDAMTIIELGKEMKRLGIHRDRRDNMITMRSKIKAKLHGQNAA